MQVNSKLGYIHEVSKIMSWEYSHYEAYCAVCGHAGVCIQGSDDWGRSSTGWEGFAVREPDPTAVGRMRADWRDLTPLCKCGSTQIVVGRCLD